MAVVLTIFHYNNDIMLIGVVRIWVFTPFVEIEWGFFIFKIQLKTYINIVLKPPHKPLESLINIILYVLGYVRVFEWIWSKDILKCNFFSPTLTTTTTTPNRSLDDWTTKNFNHAFANPCVRFQTRISRYCKTSLSLVHSLLPYYYQSYFVNMLRIPKQQKWITLFHHCVVCEYRHISVLQQKNQNHQKTVQEMTLRTSWI